MEGHHYVQPRTLLPMATLCAIMSTLAGCAALDPMAGVEGLGGLYFGEAVSVSGNGMLIGSPGDAFGKRPGSAYIFGRTSGSWHQITALSAKNGKPGNNLFGSAVALAESTALVGARWSDSVGPLSGSAYIFERSPTGWHQASVLISPDARKGHLLGYSVALDGSTAVVGAPGVRDIAQTPPAWSGAVYVWSKDDTGWRYQARITPDSPSLPPSPSAQLRPYHQWEDFGSKVAIHGDVLVVRAQNGTTSPGAVYVFRRVDGAWKQETKLEQQQTSFGIAIAISNGIVAVASSGSVFVYARIDGVWRLQARVSPNVTGEDAGFGDAGPVAIDGNLMVVGVPRYKKRKGAAFIFERSGEEWKQVAMITGDDTQPDSLTGGRAGDMFGGSISIYGEVIVVGASFHDSAGPNNGAAYVFEREGIQWLQTTKLVAQIPKDYRNGVKSP